MAALPLGLPMMGRSTFVGRAEDKVIVDHQATGTVTVQGTRKRSVPSIWMVMLCSYLEEHIPRLFDINGGLAETQSVGSEIVVMIGGGGLPGNYITGQWVSHGLLLGLRISDC